MCLLVTGLGKQKMILGFPWLQKHNPIINWQTGTFEWQHIPQKINFRKQIKNLLAGPLLKPTVTKEEDPDEWMTWTVNVLGTDCWDALISPLIEIQEKIMDKGAWINPETKSVWICSKTNLATDMAIAENLKKDNLTDKQIVPLEYHEYLDIFNKKRASWFPDKWPWDHKIEMKPGFEPKSFKNYNLTPAEQEKLDKFLKENLEKGYIQKSESPMASPFFLSKRKMANFNLVKTTNFWMNGWSKMPICYHLFPKLWINSRCQIFHEIGCLMGLWQHKDKGRRQMESCFQHNQRTVWTHSYVLQHV